MSEGGEGHCDGEREAAAIDPLAEFGREAAGQDKPSLDPGLLSPQELRDRG
jgi:hypothetical protein